MHELFTKTSGRLYVFPKPVPDEYVDGFTVVCAKHNMEGTQKRLQHIHETNRHLLHLIKNKDRAATFRQVAQHPVF